MAEEFEHNVPPRIADGWHLDKRIPIALIIAILVHVDSSIWWASGKDSTDKYQSEQLARLERRSESLENTISTIDLRLARVEEKMTYIADAMRDVRDVITRKK